MEQKRNLVADTQDAQLVPVAQKLPISDLHLRHSGVTEAIANSYSEAASVCLEKHHVSPAEFSVEQIDVGDSTWLVEWTVPTAQLQGAWANIEDAKEAAGYCLAIASCEGHLGLITIRRAEIKTGADYYVCFPGMCHGDLENALRLEVTGSDGDDTYLMRRIMEKVRQALAADNNLPALASVVGLKAKRVILSRIELGLPA